MTGRRRQLAGIDDWTQALGPQAVGGAVPAIPALPAQIHDRWRVAIELGHSDPAPKVIGPVALGNVAACAGLRAAGGETLIEEQDRAELDRVRFSRDTVGQVLR